MKHFASSLILTAALLLIPLGILAEKKEGATWNARLVLPSFDVKENLHTPNYSAGMYLPPVITRDVTLLAKDTPVLVRGVVHIPQGVTMTITPGTHILFHEYSGFDVEGTIIAQGTESAPIIFSTNEKNINNRTWVGILLHKTGKAIIDYSEIRYASPGISCMEGSMASITRSTLSFGNIGIFSNTDSCTYTDTTFTSDIPFIQGTSSR